MQHFPPETQRYFAALGSFVAFWAATEFRLDEVAQRVIQVWDGEPPEKLLPKNLSAKIRLLDEYIQTHDLGLTGTDQFQELFRANAAEIVSDLHRVGEARHWAAHGNGLLTIVARHDKDTIEFVRSLRRQAGRTESRSYSLAQLEKLTRESWSLTQRLFVFDYLVLKGIGQDAFSKAFPGYSGELAGIFKVSKRLRDKIA